MMKKYLFMITLVCAMACTKYEPKPLDPIAVEGVTVISSDIESLLLGEDVRVWPEGAYVGVFGSTSGSNEKYILKRADAGLKSADFYGPNVKGTCISAYFPYDVSYAGSAESMPVTLAALQDYDSKCDAVKQFLKYSPTAYAFLSDGKMAFKYAFGMMRVRIELDETLTINSLTLESAGEKLAGIGQIEPKAGLVMGATATEEVILSCGGTPSRSGENVTDFYLTAVPGVYSELKLSIDVEGEEFPIVCILKDIEIPRISAANFRLASVVVKTSSLPGFESQVVEFD